MTFLFKNIYACYIYIYIYIYVITSFEELFKFILILQRSEASSTWHS